MASAYLIAYNGLNFFLWAVVLGSAISLLSVTDYTSFAESFQQTHGALLRLTQSLAIMECIHPLLGLVKTNVTTTLTQVSTTIK